MTKQELRDYRHLRAEIRQIDDEIEYWYTRAEHCTRAPDKAPVIAGQTDPLPDIIDKISECEKARAEKTKQLINIEEILSNLSAQESRLMRLYYVKGLSWYLVATEMNYSIQHVWRVHGSALNKLESL